VIDMLPFAKTLISRMSPLANWELMLGTRRIASLRDCSKFKTPCRKSILAVGGSEENGFFIFSALKLIIGWEDLQQ